MMIFDIAVDVKVDVEFLEVVVVDVELIYLHKDVLDDAGWEWGVDDPKTLDIHLGSRSQGISTDVVFLQVMNPANWWMMKVMMSLSTWMSQSP